MEQDVNLLSADQAPALDALFKEATREALDEIMKKTLEEPGSATKSDNALSTLMLGLSATIGIGIFKEKLRKALLGELNAALTKDPA